MLNKFKRLIQENGSDYSFDVSNTFGLNYITENGHVFTYVPPSKGVEFDFVLGLKDKHDNEREKEVFYFKFYESYRGFMKINKMEEEFTQILSCIRNNKNEHIHFVIVADGDLEMPIKTFVYEVESVSNKVRACNSNDIHKTVISMLPKKTERNHEPTISEVISNEIANGNEMYEKFHKWCSSHELCLNADGFIDYENGMAIVKGRKCNNEFIDGTFTCTTDELSKAESLHFEISEVIKALDANSQGPWIAGLAIAWNKVRSKHQLSTWLDAMRENRTTLCKVQLPCGDESLWDIIFSKADDIINQSTQAESIQSTDLKQITT